MNASGSITCLPQNQLRAATCAPKLGFRARVFIGSYGPNGRHWPKAEWLLSGDRPEEAVDQRAWVE
jgi:hypothetical protein